MLATKSKQLEKVKLLLQNLADKTRKNNSEMTALAVAKLHLNPDIINVLNGKFLSFKLDWHIINPLTAIWTVKRQQLHL